MSSDRLSKRIHARAQTLTPSLARVANYIDSNRLEVMTKSAIEIGAAIGTSDATVIRAVQALGFDGLRDLKDALAESLGRGETAADNMVRTFAELHEDADAAINRVFDDHHEAIAALSSQTTRAQIARAVAQLASVRRIGVFGIGLSSHLAAYFGMLLARAGRKVRLFDGAGAALPDQLLNIEDVEALVMLAYGRPYKEAIAVMNEARRLKKPVVLVTDTIEGRLSGQASVVVAVHRGQAGRVALHGATFVCLEAFMLALAAHERPLALSTLEKLNDLRKVVG